MTGYDDGWSEIDLNKTVVAIL